MRRRILVTGSRDWTDAETIRAALSEAWHMLGRPHDAVLVQGECHLGGADQIAAETWRGWGYPVEGHSAEMGPDGHVLGPKRNAHMVSLGAVVWDTGRTQKDGPGRCANTVIPGPRRTGLEFD